MGIDPYPTSSPEQSDSMEEAPRHPVPQLQGPFEESMREAMVEQTDSVDMLDAHARRVKLLENKRYERICAGRWKQKSGEKYHPLWKLSAQLSFGVHLLAEGIAKSDEEVMNILQAHVDDIDGFLERTTEDFQLAKNDIEERLGYLRLPLEHIQVFDRMLEDRKFRNTIVEGNEKIEHIVKRTNKALRDALKDCQKGLYATKSLGKYLEDLKSLGNVSPDFEAVHIAMMGNCAGWHGAFKKLIKKGNYLSVALVQLLGVVDEMQRRCGIISRKCVIKSENKEPKSATTNPEARAVDSLEANQIHLIETPARQDMSAYESTRRRLEDAPDSVKAQEISLAHQKSQSRRQPRLHWQETSEASRKEHKSEQQSDKSSTPVTQKRTSKQPPIFRRFLSGADVKADIKDNKKNESSRKKRESHQVSRGDHETAAANGNARTASNTSLNGSNQASRPPYLRIKPTSSQRSLDPSPSSGSRSLTSKLSKGWSNDSGAASSARMSLQNSGSHLSLKFFSRKQSDLSQPRSEKGSHSPEVTTGLSSRRHGDSPPVKASPDPGLPTLPSLMDEIPRPPSNCFELSALPEESSSSDPWARRKVSELPGSSVARTAARSKRHLASERPHRLNLAEPSPAESVDDPMKVAVPMILDIPAPAVPGRSSKRESKSRDATARLLENIIATTTPPASPMEGPTQSWAALVNNSGNQVWASDSSLYHSILAPPQQAEPPAPPGGRRMVSPDYAKMGAFQGERKQSTGLPPMSPIAWKKMFASGGGGSATNRSSPSGEILDRPPLPDESQWFKGLGKDGVWETVQ